MLLLHASYEHFLDFCENLFENWRYGETSDTLSSLMCWPGVHIDDLFRAFSRPVFGYLKAVLS